MKKLFYILVLFISQCQPAMAQYDGEDWNMPTQNWKANCTTVPTGLSCTTLNLFSEYLLQSGDWGGLGPCWILGIDNAIPALTSITFPSNYTATNVNSMAFASKLGYTSNGTSSYLNLQWIANTANRNFPLNDAFLGYWIRTITSTVNQYDIGCSDGTNFLVFDPYNNTSGSNFFWDAYFNITASNIYASNPATGTGLQVMIRSNSTTVTTYQNTVLLAGGSGTPTSSSIPAKSVYVGANNNNGTAANFSIRQISFVLSGQNSKVSQTNVYNAITTILVRRYGW